MGYGLGPGPVAPPKGKKPAKEAPKAKPPVIEKPQPPKAPEKKVKPFPFDFNIPNKWGKK